MLADTTHALARWWAPALAFVAGIVSFASPCVFSFAPVRDGEMIFRSPSLS